MKDKKSIIILVACFVLGGLSVYLLMQFFQSEKSVSNSHVIEYELKRMNKMVVAEQQYSEIFSQKSRYSVYGFHDLFGFDKKVVLLVNAKVQASYDLSQMEVELDSVNQVIRIEKIPELKVETFPDVSFYDLEQSTFNQYKKEELNKVKANAIKTLEKKIDKEKLEKEAEEQLIINLKDLYLLAKQYGWTVENKTTFSDKVLKELN